MFDNMLKNLCSSLLTSRKSTSIDNLGKALGIVLEFLGNFVWNTLGASVRFLGTPFFGPSLNFLISQNFDD